MAESKQNNAKKNTVRKPINKVSSSAAKRSKSVVKKTTRNGDGKSEKHPADGKKVFPHLNPEGKNQTTYRTFRDAVHIYCEFHPEKVEKCIETLVEGAIAGNPIMLRTLGEYFGGPDKQKVELSGSVENKRRSPLFDLSIDEIRKLKALKGLKK